MNILLVAVNAKYIHTCPAIYSLKAFADQQSLPDVSISLAEYTINDRYDDVLSGILSRPAQIIGFSTYIWNAERVHHLIKDIRKILEDRVLLWAGGPEASNDPEAFLLGDGADLCMLGEGEQVFSCLADVASRGLARDREALAKIRGIAFDSDGKLVSTGQALPADMNRIPFLYRDLSLFSHRILYYEASRGCPFACAYCLSGKERGVRYRDLSTVEKELQFFLDNRVRQVKFTDRTFNADSAFALHVWQYLRDHDNGVTNFHFELEAGCMTDEQLALLGSLRPGLIQVEIGVQSANPVTLGAVRRRPELGAVRKAARSLISRQNINVHLDLIAGLPFEDLKSFQNSFNTVYAMRPHQLQLGFLKLLKGTELYEKREEYGLVCSDIPPYEVLRTRWLSYEDLILLHQISDRVEEFVNSQGFARSLPLIEALFPDAFTMFRYLTQYIHEQGYDVRQPSAALRYELLSGFACAKLPGKAPLEASARNRLEDTIRFDKALHIHAARRMEAEETFLFLEKEPVRYHFDYTRTSPVNKEASFRRVSLS